MLYFGLSGCLAAAKVSNNLGNWRCRLNHVSLFHARHTASWRDPELASTRSSTRSCRSAGEGIAEGQIRLRCPWCRLYAATTMAHLCLEIVLTITRDGLLGLKPPGPFRRPFSLQLKDLWGRTSPELSLNLEVIKLALENASLEFRVLQGL